MSSVPALNFECRFTHDLSHPMLEPLLPPLVLGQEGAGHLFARQHEIYAEATQLHALALEPEGWAWQFSFPSFALG